MCGYAGDITSAQNRIGINTALVMVKGGTVGTAIKVVTCSTSDGDFTDYAVLETSGTADLVKGYFVDLTGADKYIKVTGAKLADTVFADCNFDPKGIVASGSVPSIADLDNNKTATINVSTYTDPVEVTPTQGKDGMKKATITLSHIPQIEANKAQSIDVSTYTEAVEIEPTSPNDAMAKATITLSNIPALKLYAFGDAEGVVYLAEIPAEDGSCTAYVPSATGLEATQATYAEATGVTVSTDSFARYTDGDLTF